MNLKNSTFEWICRGEESQIKRLLRIAVQWICILFGIVAILLGYLPFLVMALLFGIGWLILYRSQRIEYEFTYLMGDLEIFRISNGARRKKKFQCTLEEINYLVKKVDVQGKALKFYFDATQVYTMQVNNSKGQTSVLLEADERFVKILEQERKLR